MGLTRTAIGTTLPLTTEEVRTYLKVTNDQEDALLDTLQLAAIDYVNTACNKLCIRRDTYTETFDSWGDCGYLYLRARPLYSVSSLVYQDSNNAPQTVSASNYYVDADSNRVGLKTTWTQPSLGTQTPLITVTYVAGYGTSADMPAIAKVLLLTLIAHWYENRETVLVGTVSKSIEFAAEAMMDLLSMPRVF